MGFQNKESLKGLAGKIRRIFHAEVGARLRGVQIDRKVLFLTFVVMACLSIFRAFDYWITGFFAPDEQLYANDATTGAIYGYRWFFGSLNILLFRIFGIDSANKFAIFLPFYIFFWSCLTFYLIFKTLKLLEFDPQTIALSLFSSLFLIVFVLLSLGFLTEPSGISFAMLGMFLLVKFAKGNNGESKHSTLKFLLVPLFASLSYVAASGTREPYNLFLLAGIPIVALLAIGGRKNLGDIGKRRRWTIVILAVFLFTGPSIFFLQYPNNFISQQILPISISFVQNLTHPLAAQNSTTTLALLPTTSTTLITNSSSSHTTLITNSSSSHTVVQVSRLTGTALIFFGGLVLGWGPILSIVSLVGLCVLTKKVLMSRDTLHIILLILSVLALSSFLLVSFLVSVIPNYFSFGNYSTILRFSDTALPAYFLTAPLALSFAARNKKYTMAVLAALLIFALIAIPVYESYAASNIAYVSSNASYSGSNPFSLSYRSPAVQVRDYVSSHQSDAPFYILGVPYGWIFTPGTADLKHVSVYSYLSYSKFQSYNWQTFYLYIPQNNISGIIKQDPYLVEFIQTQQLSNNSTGTPSPYQFMVMSDDIVLQSPSFVLEKIELVWEK